MNNMFTALIKPKETRRQSRGNRLIRLQLVIAEGCKNKGAARPRQGLKDGRRMGKVDGVDGGKSGEVCVN